LRRDLYIHLGVYSPQLHVSSPSCRRRKWGRTEYSLSCARLWTSSWRLFMVRDGTRKPFKLLHRVHGGWDGVCNRGSSHPTHSLKRSRVLRDGSVGRRKKENGLPDAITPFSAVDSLSFIAFVRCTWTACASVRFLYVVNRITSSSSNPRLLPYDPGLG